MTESETIDSHELVPHHQKKGLRRVTDNRTGSLNHMIAFVRGAWMLVLDSSYFFSSDALPEEDHVCPPGVIRELENHGDPRLALWESMIRVSDCSKASMDRVTEAARGSGDLGRLSPVDMTVLALALDVDGTILSDDYSIQNVARILGIPFRAVGTAGIKKVAKWNYQCTGCHKWYKEKLPECPVCGSPMRACRKRRSREEAPRRRCPPASC